MAKKLRLYTGKITVNVPLASEITHNIGLAAGRTPEEARKSLEYHAEVWKELRKSAKTRINVTEVRLPGYEISVRES